MKYLLYDLAVTVRGLMVQATPQEVKMYSALYDPLPDVKKTLERIGCGDLEIRHDLETLDALIIGYATHVPYENLEVSYEHRLPSLAVKDLYNKIVAHRRGGYCFEMNGIFWALLRDLGFDVYSVSVYVLENVDSMGDLGHRSNIVTIDGEKYFVEVGFGRNSVARSAIPLNGYIRNGFFISYDADRREYTVYKIVDVEKEKARGFERFLEKRVVDGEEVVCKKLQLFRDFMAYPQEFYLPNKGVFYTPENPMIGRKVCHLHNAKDETYTIVDNEFSCKTAEGRTVREIKDDEDLRDILRTYLGIELPEKDN